MTFGIVNTPKYVISLEGQKIHFGSKLFTLIKLHKVTKLAKYLSEIVRQDTTSAFMQSIAPTIHRTADFIV